MTRANSRRMEGEDEPCRGCDGSKCGGIHFDDYDDDACPGCGAEPGVKCHDLCQPAAKSKENSK